MERPQSLHPPPPPATPRPAPPAQWEWLYALLALIPIALVLLLTDLYRKQRKGTLPPKQHHDEEVQWWRQQWRTQHGAVPVPAPPELIATPRAAVIPRVAVLPPPPPTINVHARQQAFPPLPPIASAVPGLNGQARRAQLLPPLERVPAVPIWAATPVKVIPKRS